MTILPQTQLHISLYSLLSPVPDPTNEEEAGDPSPLPARAPPSQALPCHRRPDPASSRRPQAAYASPLRPVRRAPRAASSPGHHVWRHAPPAGADEGRRRHRCIEAPVWRAQASGHQSSVGRNKAAATLIATAPELIMHWSNERSIPS